MHKLLCVSAQSYYIRDMTIDIQWFKEQIKLNNCTQDEIGKAIGKDRSTASRLLSGELEFKPAYAKGFSDLFKIEISEVLIKAGLEEFVINAVPENFIENMEQAIEAFKNGEMLIVTDDDDRENEGDLIVAASKVTPEQMAFIIRHTSGIVCAPLSKARAQELRLDPMVVNNDAPHATAFTITVDAKEGTTTGISAAERCTTVRALSNNNIGADGFVRPGHIFPLIAREGGVLVRTGHTEATVDLCRLAGLSEVGVICEMVNDDGTVMRGPDVEKFGKTHNIKKISIAQLVAYRQARDKLVDRVSSFEITTEIGVLTAYSYTTPFDKVNHLAIVHGDISKGQNIPTRLHRADIVNDVFGGASTINSALQYFKKNNKGVLIYLRDGTVGVPVNKPNEKTVSESARQQVWRDIGIGAQILKDLGIKSIDLLSNKQQKFIGLSGFGINISNTINF